MAAPFYEGTHKAGYAIAADIGFVEAQVIPAHTINMQAVLMVLTHAFQKEKYNP